MHNNRFTPPPDIPGGEAWFWTPQWLDGERQVDAEIVAGNGTVHESADALLHHLERLSQEADQPERPPSES